MGVLVLGLRRRRGGPAVGGRRLPLSYTSLYLANGAAVVPAFEDPQDSRAYELYAKLFVGREIVQVPAEELAFAGAGLRAVTLAQPSGAV